MKIIRTEIITKSGEKLSSTGKGVVIHILRIFANGFEDESLCLIAENGVKVTIERNNNELSVVR